MIEHVLHPRITENKRQPFYLFWHLYNAITKSVYEIDLVIYEFNDKYSKVYRDSSQLKVVLPFHCFCTNYFVCLFYSAFSFWLCSKTD
jgi:hypothetical protein